MIKAFSLLFQCKENESCFGYFCSMSMFSYIGIGINFFLLLLLLSKKGKIAADKILACWLFIIGCHLILFAMNLQPATVNNIHWQMGTGIPFPLLHGPFLYLYTAAMTNMLPANRKLLILHFLPAIIATLFFTPVFLLSASEKLAFMKSGARGYEMADLLRVILIQLSGFVYVIWCLLLLRKHKQNIQREFSYEEKINLNWLRYFIYGLAAIWIIIIVFKNDYYIFCGVIVFIILLGYFGIRQAGIFTQNENYSTNRGKNSTSALESNDPAHRLIHQSSKDDTNESDYAKPAVAEEYILTDSPDVEKSKDDKSPRKKYAGSGITEDASRDIHTRLRHLMDAEKLFTEPALSLTMLAKKLAIHPNYLSQVINEKEGKTFFEYINTLRIEEFIRLIEMPESKQYTMMSLAYDCGFNSKTAFYRNFKTLTGQTPTDYLNQQNIKVQVE